METNNNEEFQKDLFCPMCLEILRQPKLLTCMHTFCETCIKPLIAYDTGELTCPICRHVTKTLDGTSSLTSNFIAQNIIDAHEVMNLQADGELKCSECDQDAASTFCCDCYQRLCPVCSVHHKRSLRFKAHHVLEFDKINRDHISQGKIKYCEKHGEVLKYFCRNCGHTICSDCTASKDHNGHVSLLLKEVVLENKEELKDLVTKAARKRKAMFASIGEAENILLNLNDVKDYSVHLVEETFGRLSNLLTAKKVELIEKLNKRFDEGVESIEKAKENSRILDEWISFTNTVIDSRCNGEIMNVFHNLKSQLDDVSLVEYMKPKLLNDQSEDHQEKLDVVTLNHNTRSKRRLSSASQISGFENSTPTEVGAPYETHYPETGKLNGFSRSSSVSSSQLSLTEVDASEINCSSSNKVVVDSKNVAKKLPPRPPPPSRSTPSSSAYPSPQSVSALNDCLLPEPPTLIASCNSKQSTDDEAKSKSRFSKPLVFKKAFLAKRRFTIIDKVSSKLKLSDKRRKSFSNTIENETAFQQQSASTRSRSRSTSEDIKRPSVPPPAPPTLATQMRSRSQYDLRENSKPVDDIKRLTFSPSTLPTPSKNQESDIFPVPPTALSILNFPLPPSRPPSVTSSLDGSSDLEAERIEKHYTEERNNALKSNSQNQHDGDKSKINPEDFGNNAKVEVNVFEKKVSLATMNQIMQRSSCFFVEPIDVDVALSVNKELSTENILQDSVTIEKNIPDSNNNSGNETSKIVSPPPRNLLKKQQSTPPHPPSRFSAGITMYRQELQVNNLVLDMIAETINNTCAISLDKDTKVPQSEFIFTMFEKVFNQ